MKKVNQYLSNKHLYGILIRYKNELKDAREVNKELPKIPEDIGQSILLICSNLIKKSNFSGYSSQYREEMTSDAIVDCISSIENFDPDKTNNPFAYFSQIAWNAYIRRIQKEKKQQYIKLKNYESTIVLSNNFDHFDQSQHQFNEITSQSIRDYEDKYLNKGVETPPKKKKKKYSN